MAMKLVVARRLPDPPQFRLVVLLDEARVTADGAPDPAWTFEHVAAAQPPAGAGLTAAQWKQAVLDDAKQRAREELARRQAARAAGAALPEEGTTFA